MNAYADLTQVKGSSYLNIVSTNTDHDTYLRKILEASSRLIDKYCQRYFYTQNATHYYDGSGTKLYLPEDLLSITTLKTDEDGDATYENTFDSGDYHLYPLNEYPKIRIEINPNGDFGGFASGIQKGVQIVGVFGYGDGTIATPYIDSGTTTNEALDTTETSVDVAAGTALSAGQTILVELEQMYILSISTNTCTVRRAVNGTTAATHDTGKAVYIYEYPSPIAQACLIATMRAWKRKDSAYQDIVGNPETGQITISKGIDPDVAATLKEYRKWRYM